MELSSDNKKFLTNNSNAQSGNKAPANNLCTSLFNTISGGRLSLC